jgi:seryl-tRNA synthetase
MLVCVGLYWYHSHSINVLNENYSRLLIEHTELQEANEELSLKMEKALSANQENIKTIGILRSERRISDKISRDLESKNKELSETNKRIIESSKLIGDSTISDKLVHILNEVNGIKK